MIHDVFPHLPTPTHTHTCTNTPVHTHMCLMVLVSLLQGLVDSFCACWHFCCSSTLIRRGSWLLLLFIYPGTINPSLNTHLEALCREPGDHIWYSCSAQTLIPASKTSVSIRITWRGASQVVKNLCQCRRHEFNLWSGKIFHASGHLNPRAITTEPTCPGTRALHQEKPPQSETCTARLESSPHSPHLQKSPRSHEDPAQPKINRQFF